MSLFTYVNESEYETLDLLWDDKGRGKYVRSDQTRAKISETNACRTKEQKLAYGQAATEARITNGNSLIGEKNPMYGKKHTNDAIEKMRIASTGRVATTETRKKMSKKRKHKSTMGYRWHTPNGVFDTNVLAAEAMGISPTLLRYRAKAKNFPEYYKEKLDK